MSDFAALILENNVTKHALLRSQKAVNECSLLTVKEDQLDLLSEGAAMFEAEVVIVIESAICINPYLIEAVRDRFQADPHLGLVYSYSIKLNTKNGGNSEEVKRPSWSPERLLATQYVGPVVAIKTDILISNDWALLKKGLIYQVLLNLSKRDVQADVIRDALYEENPTSEYLSTSLQLPQLQRFLSGYNNGISAIPSRTEGIFEITRPYLTNKKISIVIPTRGTSGVVLGEDQIFAVEAVRSVLSTAVTNNLEFVIVYDTGTPEIVLDKIKELTNGQVVFVEYTKPFNFSEKCNIGFLESTGDIVVMMNDDVRAITPHFIDDLVAPLQDNTVGMTGAFLLFEDGTIQHAGHWYSGRSPRHAMIGQGATQSGPFNDLLVNREVSGLTAACIAFTRETYVRVGGFSELLPSNYNDVDFSRKVSSLGKRLIWLHAVKGFHFESKTRVGTVYDWERELIHKRWGIPSRDPFWPHSS